jgi:hypothetical protein
MSEADERDAFERMVDRVLSYRPKKKRKRKRKAKAEKKKAKSNKS